ncbi:MAG: class I SAM-dependent methyltransferase [Pegethrix bostrychoides GSE-TBD4-15B]|jgi:hypothetical protein|uniref:Class I SAM-dependent methyltransferase n=1 Tax=Pegethrix bostrychoides GSE-TBD4-15B TaxID=2839662 RepID=A0A951P6P0_9CYAN|nr:class I SAM-dependent methyltransferase [Pegethrix bostrychoides GSE-TBD4-15B]
MTILDEYTTSAPSLQSLLDLFKDEWSSKLPEPLADLRAGSANLFEDARIDWIVEQIGGFQAKTVLELGPLEAGHSYMMHQKGAESILAIEANSRAYLKCLIIKEMFQLDRLSLLYGDFIEFLRANQAQFDLCVASGVLYHMRNPAELIGLIAKAADQMFIWTHYYDEELLKNHSTMSHRISEGKPSAYQGFSHMLYRQEYGASLGWNGFCGGSAPYSQWMSRADILDCCKHFGFSEIQICFDDTNHPNGPAFALLATKSAIQPTQVSSVPQSASPFAEIGTLKQQLDKARLEIERLKTESSACSSRIQAMETSKFWKLRKSWFAFKKTFGLPSNEP